MAEEHLISALPPHMNNAVNFVVAGLVALLCIGAADSRAEKLDAKKMARGKALVERLQAENPPVNQTPIPNKPYDDREAFHYYIQHTYNYGAVFGDWNSSLAGRDLPVFYIQRVQSDMLSEVVGYDVYQKGARFNDWFQLIVEGSGRIGDKATFDRYIATTVRDLRTKHGAKQEQLDRTRRQIDEQFAREGKKQKHDNSLLNFFGVAVLFVAAVWSLPIVVAWRRKHPQLQAIAVTNILGGLVFGIGWAIALVWAFTKPTNAQVIVPQPIPPGPSRAPERREGERLRELRKLRDDGLITEEEFQHKRTAIITSM